MRSKSNPKVFILITNDMMEDRTSFKQVLWRTHIWELFFTPNYSSLPSYLSSPSPSQTNTLPPKTRCSERCATRASLWVPKAWFMPTVYSGVDFWYTLWRIGKQRHSHTNHLHITVQCPMPAFTMWHMEEKWELLPVLWASEDNKWQREQFANL